MNIKKTTTAPTDGVNEVQRLTIGGTPTSGTFKAILDGLVSGAITWSATNGTLLANMQAAFDTLLGTNNTLVEAASLTLGIGTINITYQNDLGKKDHILATIADNSLVGTVPTLAITNVTAGVEATMRNSAKGQLLIYTTPDPPATYQNISNTRFNPTWVASPDTSNLP